MISSRVAFVIAVFAFLVAPLSIAVGQRVGGSGTIKETTPAAPTRSTTVPVKIITKYIPKPVTSTTGRLFVSAEPDAVLLVEPLNKARNAEAQQGTVPAGRRDFIFNDLKPGRYRVAGTLAGYHQSDTEVVIEANKSQSVTLNFNPILYSVTINTEEVETGEIKYALQGQSLSNVVSINKGIVRLSLRPGEYAVEIVPAEFGYETLHTTFSLSRDGTVLNLKPKRIVLTTETLSPRWTSSELKAWEMPASWQADARNNLLVNGAGIALPRDQSFRYYKDFKLVSSVRMVNGVSVSFALRAADSQNYYLLQLTGEKSDEPYTARLFLIKNGVEQRLRVIPISRTAAGAMRSGQFFSVSIKMVDYTITVEIEDSQTGAPYILGALTDPDRNFPVGAVGIAARKDAQNVVGLFVVCTGAKCLNE